MVYLISQFGEPIFYENSWKMLSEVSQKSGISSTIRGASSERKKVCPNSGNTDLKIPHLKRIVPSYPPCLKLPGLTVRHCISIYIRNSKNYKNNQY